MDAREASGAGSPCDPAPTPHICAPHSSSEIVLLDEHGVILAVNEAWRTSVDHRGLKLAGHGVGQTYFDLARHFLPHVNLAGFERGLAQLRAGETDQVQLAFPIETARGPRWRQLQVQPMRLGEDVRYVVIHEDLTELVRAQEALSHASERLLSVQEEERQRIALELHDSMSQHLAVLGLGLARLQRLEDGADRRELLEDMGSSLREAVKETRVLSYLLKPTGLMQEGLAITARRFVEGFALRTGLALSFTATDSHTGLSAPVEHAAFRIVQEALSNVYRHAAATRASVELRVEDGVLKVRVADNGRGMRRPPGRADEGAQLGVGIVGMRARVEQLGGDLSIRSTRSGTRIAATIPAGAGR